MPSRYGLLAALLVVACRDTDPAPTGTSPYDVAIGPYEAEVRWTEYGIPHVKANDYGSLGYGMGYALGQDHLCTLLDQLVKVRSRRARYYGPGEDNEHLDSDFGWLALGLVRHAEEGFQTLDPTLQDAMVGYATGLNDHLDELGPDGLPAPCADAPWTGPITHIDLLAYYLHLGQFASGYELVDLVAQATPPSSTARRAPPPPMSAFDGVAEPPIGSNGWGIGRDRSASGRGMVLSNTHFPSDGERQWHEAHLTIPGELDVYGVSLVGVPLINMGFNERVAWTHTVSVNPRMLFYELDLEDGNPTRYLYDGQYVDMVATQHAIEVLQPDGSTEMVWRTLYASVHGPVINAPLVGWTPLNAFAYRDINAANLGMTETWMEMNLATDLESFKAAHRDHQGIPWVHTMYADADGNAWYTDSALTPNLSDAAYDAYNAFLEEDVFSSIFAESGVVLVDGGDPVFDWVVDARSAVPGAVPFDDAPQLLRGDFVNNANENHWLANPAEPLEGYPGLYGETGTPRTPRTRMNNLYLMETGPDAASGEDGLFTLEELEAAVLSARASLADKLLPQVVERCAAVTGPVSVDVNGVPSEIDIEPACAVLTAWDGTAGLDSPGIAVWREAIGSGLYDFDDMRDQGALFADAFDPADPIQTPAVLAAAEDGEDTVLQAIALAVVQLDAAGIPLDATLRDLQFREFDGERVPVLGGPYHEGVIAVATYGSGGNTTLLDHPEQSTLLNELTELTDEGYLINDGNSWIMAMEFTDDGPRARAVMVYAQSEDPASPHFSDQAWLYAEPTLRDVRYRDADIEADPTLEVRHLSHPAEGG